MRRSLVLLSLLAAAAVLAPAPTAARSSTPHYAAPAGSGALFLVTGHGWGHGVGMGQWGAQGYALQGYTYQQILAAYYPGTMLGRTSATTIRALLARGKKSLTISSGRPITVIDGNGVDHTLAARKIVLKPSLELAVDGGPRQALVPPLTFSPARGSMLSLGRAYRGKIVVDVVNGKLRAIDAVPLQQYLYGVVAAEMPSSWLPAALEAQAVAARSYVLAGHRTAASFGVSAVTRSQAYVGVSAEKPPATQAVDQTAGQVLRYRGQVATTFYSSSSGGWTQSAADAFGPPGKPYLVSVRDPYDGISPYHNWGAVTVTAKTLGNALGVTGHVVDATVSRNSSRRVRTLEVTSVASGAESTTSVAGSAVASALGLRSTWFTVGVLSLQPPFPNRPVTPGARVTLTGVVRGLRGAVVQERTAGGPWKQLARVAPAAKTGAFNLVVEPAQTTDYRLATALDAAAFVRIRVQAG